MTQTNGKTLISAVGLLKHISGILSISAHNRVAITTQLYT